MPSWENQVKPPLTPKAVEWGSRSNSSFAILRPLPPPKVSVSTVYWFFLVRCFIFHLKEVKWYFSKMCQTWIPFLRKLVNNFLYFTILNIRREKQQQSSEHFYGWQESHLFTQISEERNDLMLWWKLFDLHCSGFFLRFTCKCLVNKKASFF